MDEFMKFQAEMDAIGAKDAEASENAPTDAPTDAPAPARAVPGPTPRPAPRPIAAHGRATIARTAERVPAGPTAPPPPPRAAYASTASTATTTHGRVIPGVEYKPIGKALARKAGGDKWDDSSLAEWPEDDHRIFVGDLGNECNDEMLARAFAKYPSFAKAKVVMDKMNPGKNKGYGFVSFLDIGDYARAMKEMAGKFIGNRPVKLRKSTWSERTDDKRQVKGLGGKKRGVPLHKRKHIPIGPSLK